MFFSVVIILETPHKGLITGTFCRVVVEVEDLWLQAPWSPHNVLRSRVHSQCKYAEMFKLSTNTLKHEKYLTHILAYSCVNYIITYLHRIM